MFQVKLENEQIKFKKIGMSGLYLLERVSLGDERGFLSKFGAQNEMKEAGWEESIAQINHTFNQKNWDCERFTFFKDRHMRKRKWLLA